MVKSGHEMFDERRSASGYIRIGDLLMKLRLRDERLDDLLFFFLGFVPVKIEQIVYAEAVR